MKIALVHDYLTQGGGAERVFELLCQYFPSADIFTSLYDPEKSIDLGERVVKTTVLQHLPGAKKYFRLLAPLYYTAFRTLDLQNYDLIISSSTSFAKAVRKRPDAYHICLCHNVTRFLWDTETYLKEYSDYKKFYPLIEQIFALMRMQDLRYAQEPDMYISNSSAVADRIRKTYNRQAKVIHYPIRSKNFSFSSQKEDFYLVASRLLGYKHVDITVKAFNELGWPLVIIGDGPERKWLESQAADNITFLGRVSDAERRCLMSKARSVIVAALEDYGLVPIEANASGTPVIAYGAGGALETQIHGMTGMFFEEQTPESLKRVLLEARNMTWDHEQIRKHALSNFSEKIFFRRLKRVLNNVCDNRTMHTNSQLFQTIASGAVG
ncbi:MAG: glycosyltransferase [Leptolyngbyaceae cyanobacterium MO_188.B28]|nr:glycosyltransferase [Leptolyngbyaceae cyanobacterium MO_188.B28]